MLNLFIHATSIFAVYHSLPRTSQLMSGEGSVRQTLIRLSSGIVRLPSGCRQGIVRVLSGYCQVTSYLINAWHYLKWPLGLTRQFGKLWHQNMSYGLSLAPDIPTIWSVRRVSRKRRPICTTSPRTSRMTHSVLSCLKATYINAVRDTRRIPRITALHDAECSGSGELSEYMSDCVLGRGRPYKMLETKIKGKGLLQDAKFVFEFRTYGESCVWIKSS